MLLDDRQHRRALDLALGEQFGEHRRLQNAQPDVEADADQHEAERERNPPAPGQELLAGHLAEGEHGEVGEEQSAGTPNCGQDAISPRERSLRAHSIDISTEPPHSPPTPTPWMNRSTVRITAPQMPMLS
jgi:hypothetical protein